jgi:hypothetical protein
MVQVVIHCLLTAGTALAVVACAGTAIPKSCRPSVHAHSTSFVPIVPPLGWRLSRRTVVVGVVALLGAALVALALSGRSSLDVGTVALAVPGSGLVDGLCWWLSGPVGVELRVVACGVVSQNSQAVSLKIAYPATRTCSAIIISYCALIKVSSSAPLRPALWRGAAAEARGQVQAYLGSNCRHLGGLERLVRFALLDAQSAGVKRKMRELALRY